MKNIKENWKKWSFYFLLGLALILSYKIIEGFDNILGVIVKFFTILSPFFIGILIAYLLYMPCRKLEELFRKTKVKAVRKKARQLSVISVYIIFILLIAILVRVILPVVVESVKDLGSNMQMYFEIAVDKYNKLPEDSVFKEEVVKEIVTYLDGIDIKEYIHFDKITKYLMGAFNAVTSIFNIFVSLIVSVYILIERSQIIKFFRKCLNATLNETTYKSVNKYFNNSNEIFFKFIVSQFLDAVIVGILVTIAMSIMKIKYAPLLGFIIGLFNMIPYVGAIIAVGFSAIITLITGGLSQAFWMLVVVIILQQIDANIINPKIVGQSLKISPLLVIFAVTLGGAYFGMLGMFLAVPLVAVIKIVVEDYVNLRLEQKKMNKKIKE